MESAKVAIVTGGNKGIGFAIVGGLCKQFEGDVYLTARDEGRGLEAVAKLQKEGLNPKFHQLDIEDQASVDRLAEFIRKNYGNLDILVNNAGFAYKQAATEPFEEQAEVTLRINYWGTLRVCESLFPLLRSHARVVNVSSFVSLMALNKCSEPLQKQLKSIDNIPRLNEFMMQFVDSAKKGTLEKDGWPKTAYGVSKIGVTLLSLIQQKIIDGDSSRSDIVINAVCPGYVDTDMTSHKGTKTIDQGADTPLYCALLPAGITEPRGRFISEREAKDV